MANSHARTPASLSEMLNAEMKKNEESQTHRSERTTNESRSVKKMYSNCETDPPMKNKMCEGGVYIKALMAQRRKSVQSREPIKNGQEK